MMNSLILLSVMWTAVCAAGPERYNSPIHYRPVEGRLADTIPFYWKGDYHVFYLRAIAKVPWEHIVSNDLIHWKELPAALRPDGAPDGPDGLHMFTGSVTEHQGTFHIFYTGWNPENKAGREKIMHATSPDLIAWTKHPEDGFFASGQQYENTDFRDPFVFWNEADRQFWMVVCARDAKTSQPVQGVLKSKDLVHWQESKPLVFDPPLGKGTPECPDLFKIGATYYLIDSPSAGTTDMRYSEQIEGPYRIPKTSSIDTPILYAAKRMFDGKRHILTGWIRDLRGESDAGGHEWGGDQSVPREVYPGSNGMLFFKPVPEAVNVFKTERFKLEKPVSLKEGVAFSEAVPDDYYLECEVKLSLEAQFALTLRKSEPADSGYRLTLRPSEGMASIVGKAFSYERPVDIDTKKPVKIRAFVQGSIIECFINEAYAFSCRAYDCRTGGLALSVEKGTAEIASLTVKLP